MSEALVPTVEAARQDITATGQEVEGYLRTAHALVILNPDVRYSAGEDLKTIKGIWNRIEERRKVFTVPLNKVLDEINAIFKRPQADLKTAEDTIKSKCLSFDAQVRAEQDRLRREAEAVARKEQDRLNTIAEEKARKAEAAGKVEKAEEIRQTVPQVVIQAPLFEEPVAVDGESTRKLYRARVVDEDAFYMGIASGITPKHFAMPNLTELNKAATALKKAMQYPGIEVVEVDSLATRAR
mgnify:CR=1 FL=1